MELEMAMSKKKAFEETPVWNDARNLVKEVFRISKMSDMKGEYFLQDQMKRSALSIMANIAEGFERDGNKELIQYLSMAKGSAGELRSFFFAGLDMGLVSDADFKKVQEQVQGISRQLSGFMKYLKKSMMKGRKYKDGQ
jgi:four helix bundle protein